MPRRCVLTMPFSKEFLDIQSDVIRKLQLSKVENSQNARENQEDSPTRLCVRAYAGIMKQPLLRERLTGRIVKLMLCLNAKRTMRGIGILFVI